MVIDFIYNFFLRYFCIFYVLLIKKKKDSYENLDDLPFVVMKNIMANSAKFKMKVWYELFKNSH